MLRAIVSENQNLTIEEAEIPQPQNGEMVVKVECVLTCGSDKSAWNKGINRSLGHELSGTVHSVGTGVTAFQPGQNVMFTWGASCHECPACMRGHESFCDSFDSNTIQNGMAQYALLPAAVVKHNTFVKPESLSFTNAAFLEPLAKVVQGMSKFTVHSDDVIVILGGGSLGLLLVQTIKALHAPKAIIVSDVVTNNLAKARELGATYTVNPQEEDLLAAIKRYTEDYGAQIIIDTASVPATWDVMLSLASKAATLLFFGACPNDHLLELDATRVHYDQMTICGVSNYSGADVAKAQELLAKGKVVPEALVGASFQLSSANDAFQSVANGQNVTCAILPN